MVPGPGIHGFIQELLNGVFQDKFGVGSRNSLGKGKLPEFPQEKLLRVKAGLEKGQEKLELGIFPAWNSPQESGIF